MKNKAPAPMLLLLIAAGLWLTPNRANAWAAGGHLGLNLDDANIHLGGDLLFPLVDVSPNVRLSIWPSLAYVFIDNGHDVVLFGADFPFEFRIDNSIVTPFVGPGLGLAIQHEAYLKFNVIGGSFFNVGDRVRLFAELALRFVNGTYVDLLFGVLVEL
jgi:hypothetical protein